MNLLQKCFMVVQLSFELIVGSAVVACQGWKLVGTVQVEGVDWKLEKFC